MKLKLEKINTYNPLYIVGEVIIFMTIIGNVVAFMFWEYPTYLLRGTILGIIIFICLFIRYD